MSNSKLKPLRPVPDEVIRPRSRFAASAFIRWGMSTPKHGESVRWESIDGRWVIISLGQGATVGKAVVSDSDGQSQVVETYEDALALAKTWRT